jgi:hypothetical protein
MESTEILILVMLVLGLGLLIVWMFYKSPTSYGFVETKADNTYTDENGIVHKRMQLIDKSAANYDGYFDTPIFREQSFHVARSIKIGQSSLYFCVNDKLDRFALGIPEYPTTMRFYDVSKIRKFKIVDDEAYMSWGSGSVTSNPDGHTYGSSSSGGNVYTLSVMLHLYMDDIHEPMIQLQFLRKEKAKSSTEHYEALTSAREVESVLELLTDKNRNLQIANSSSVDFT